MIITQHAIHRYIERIDPNATEEIALAAIMEHESSADKAIAFGAQTLRTARMRLCFKGETLTTVKPTRIRHTSRTIVKKWRRTKRMANEARNGY